MGGLSWQILILLVLAIVIWIRLMNEFGKRDDHEPDRLDELRPKPNRDESNVVELDDIEFSDEINLEIDKARQIEPNLRVDQFLRGARGAYEMILMSYLNGDMEQVKPFVDPDVYDGFAGAIADREAKGHKVNAEFLGLNDVKLMSANFDEATGELELGVEFLAQLKREIVDADGKVIDGNKNKIETERDLWYFARKIGSNDPNWELVATGD